MPMENTAENEKQSPFATEPIGRLIVRFAVSSVIALPVNSLYNIVDQIFIGWARGIWATAQPMSSFRSPSSRWPLR